MPGARPDGDSAGWSRRNSVLAESLTQEKEAPRRLLFLLMRREAYLALKTFRKNGEPVVTAMWFVRIDGAIFMRTGADSGKVKRIRNQPEVEFAPSNAAGRPSEAFRVAKARLVEGPEEAERIEAALRRKYGLQKSLVDLALWLGQKRDRAYLRIE